MSGTLSARSAIILVHPRGRSSDGCRGVNYGGVKNILDAVKGRTDFFVYVTGTGIYGKTNSPITSETKPNLQLRA